MERVQWGAPALGGVFGNGNAHVVFLVVGGLAIIWGVLRMLRLMPGRSRLSPTVEGLITLLVGAVLVVIGIVR